MESRLGGAHESGAATAAPELKREKEFPSAAEKTDEKEVTANGVSVPPINTNPDETNVWPDESAEAAFLAETRGRVEPVMDAPAKTEPEEVVKKLPPLEELVQRIPAETRDLLDELFRARFTTVRRVRKSDLKQ